MTKIKIDDRGTRPAVHIDGRAISGIVDFQANINTTPEIGPGGPTSRARRTIEVELTLHVEEVDFTDGDGIEWHAALNDDEVVLSKTVDT